MQIKIFNIPVGAEDNQTEELNHFLRANKIIDIKKDLATVGGNSCWTFCVTYMLGNRPAESEIAQHGKKIDYKEVLEPEVFERFSELRKIRKEVAEKEAVPAFAVFTDTELAEMSKYSPLTLKAMGKVSGIGKKKLEKYGSMFCRETDSAENEEGGVSEGTDCKS